MTQDEARIELEGILNRKLPEEYNKCSGNFDDCPIEECMLCGVRDCPDHEALHYHHDGCPCCDGVVR